jgi:hypothetical protein
MILLIAKAYELPDGSLRCNGDQFCHWEIALFQNVKHFSSHEACRAYDCYTHCNYLLKVSKVNDPVFLLSARGRRLKPREILDYAFLLAVKVRL